MSSLRRAISKLVVGPLQYRRGKGYDAQRYWNDRFTRWGSTIRGPGDEGLSEQDNEAAYALAKQAFLDLLDRIERPIEGSRVLEVGTGTGYYTRVISERRPTELVGIDITDALFETLSRELPSVEFRQQDVTRDPIAGSFDFAIMIDVLEHIVTRPDLGAALHHMTDTLDEPATIILGPLRNRSGRHLFYVRWWTAADVLRELPDWEVRDEQRFRDGDLLVLGRRSTSGK